MIKRLIYLLITLIVAMGICGCMEHNIGEKQTSAVNEDAEKIKITDMLGREVLSIKMGKHKDYCLFKCLR